MAAWYHLSVSAALQQASWNEAVFSVLHAKHYSYWSRGKFCFSLNRNDLAFGGAQLERIQRSSDLVRMAEMIINHKGCSRNIFPGLDSPSHHAGIMKRKKWAHHWCNFTDNHSLSRQSLWLIFLTVSLFFLVCLIGLFRFFPPLPFHMGKNKVKKQHFQRRKTWKEFLFSGSLLQLLICGKPQWKVSNMAASLYTRIQWWPCSKPWLF